MANFSLQRIDECDENLDSWFSNWGRAVELLNDMLSLSTSAFRVRMSSEMTVLHLVDSFLDVYPKSWDEDDTLSMYLDKRKYSKHAEDIRKIVVEVYTKILMLFMRFAIDRQEVEKRNHQITPTKNGFFTLNRLFQAVTIFKPSNSAAVNSIVAEAFERKHFTEQDVLTYMNGLEQDLNDYTANMQGISFSDCCIKETKAFLKNYIISFEGLATVSPLLFSRNISEKIPPGFLMNLAAFVEHLEEYFSMENIMKISPDTRKNYRTLLTLVDIVINSAYALFHILSNCFDSVNDLYHAFINCLHYERFIFYYSIIYSVEELIGQFDQQQKSYIYDAIAQIRWNHTRLIMEQLRRRGLLDGLGKSANADVQNTIDYLVELLPHLSPQFIHLCLRHYNYQSEQTTNSLLNTNELPLDLRALLSVELKAEKAPTNAQQSSLFFDFEDEVDSLDSLNKCIKTEHSEPLICMKPPQPAAAELNKKDDALCAHSSSGRRDPIAEFGVDTFLQKTLNKPEITRKPPVVETFDIPDSKTVALRPSYEQYRYIESSSSTDNVYNDEYDDTYDYEKNYDLEFREGDIALLRSGIEPNNNRALMDESKNGRKMSDSEDEEKAAENSGARKKNYSRNRWDFKATAARNEQGQNGAVQAQNTEYKMEEGPAKNDSRFNERGKPAYTGGRDRQLKERHKNEFRRRQADKKMRGGMF